MANDQILSTPGLKPADLMAAGRIANATNKVNAANAAKAKEAAQDFEAVFLNTMFQQMFTGMDGEGPMGGSGATGVWRSFLTNEYSKTFAKAGGIGLADDVYRTLLQQQAARP